jgi:spermidine/putrescine transport system substrate-binding protein
MRKVIFLICIMAFAIPVFAQDATPEATPAATAIATEAPAWVCPSGFSGQTLSVFNWTTYVAEDTIGNFEKLCGVKVTYDTYESNEALLSKLSGGNPGYDVAVPTDHAVADMIARGLVQPLDQSKIPNLANVTKSLLNAPYDPGNKYSVPYQWGTVGIGYNTDKAKNVTSWQDMFTYNGPVAWLDDPRAMIGIALTILGYNANTTDSKQIDEARDFLIANGKNVVAIAADDGQAMLQRGDVDMTVEYSGDIFQVEADCNCSNIAYDIPKEGTNFWIDNLVILKGAPNPALANVFLDYILDPHVGADISNYTAYATPNQASLDEGLIDASLVNDPAIYPPADLLTKSFSIQPLPDAQQLYNDAWDEIKVALGK